MKLNLSRHRIIGFLILAIIILLNVGWLLLHPAKKQDSVATTRPTVSTTPRITPGDSELFAAVTAKQTDKVAQLIKHGANLNAQDSQSRTPAMIATYNNDYPTAKALIEAGADVNIRDNMLNNPFLYSGAENMLDILKLTVEHGADPTILNRYGGTALTPAGEHGHVEIIKYLLENTKVDVNHINNPGWTAMLEAITMNNGGPRQQQAVQLLIDHGADVNIADKNGITPLRHARAQGFTEIVRILERAGAH